MAQDKTQAAINASAEISAQVQGGGATTTITVKGTPGTSQASKYYTYNQWYEKTWKNYCPLCGRTNTLSDNPKGVYEHEITCDTAKGGCGADYDVCTGGDKQNPPRAYLQDTNGNSNSVNSVDTNIGNSTTTTSSAAGSYSGYSPLLSGEQSFQQLIAEITNGIDILFLCKRNTITVTDFESIYAEAQKIRESSTYCKEDIKLWQLEDGTYELDVNEYGFYNTVNVVYSGGTITETYEDLVRVFGVMPITYYDKKLTKTQAQAKAKAYLAAHIREFGMGIKCSIAHNPAIDLGDIVTLENPLTLRDAVKKVNKGLPEYLFVKGMSISWDDGGIIRNDIELSYSPESPERDADTKTSVATSDNASNDTSGTDQTGLYGGAGTDGEIIDTGADTTETASDSWHQNVWNQLYTITKNYIDVSNRTEFTNRLYSAKTNWSVIANIIQGHKIKAGVSRNYVIGQVVKIKRGTTTSVNTNPKHATSLNGAKISKKSYDNKATRERANKYISTHKLR